MSSLSAFLAGNSNRSYRQKKNSNTYFDFRKAFDTALEDILQADCKNMD